MIMAKPLTIVLFPEIQRLVTKLFRQIQTVCAIHNHQKWKRLVSNIYGKNNDFDKLQYCVHDRDTPSFAIFSSEDQEKTMPDYKAYHS